VLNTLLGLSNAYSNMLLVRLGVQTSQKFCQKKDNIALLNCLKIGQVIVFYSFKDLNGEINKHNLSQ
jgi:hypothetical protein